MAIIDVQRAWWDGEYYLSLTEEQRSLVPNSPVGAIELGPSELAAVGICYDTQQSWCNNNSACTSRCMCVC